MTPDEHCAEADRLLLSVTDDNGNPPWELNEWGRSVIALAQVHATLALAKS